ncbi:MAG TPA: TetR/AcrR family transcriptional regulator [Candidatus Eisenbacteria bacterium]
MDTRPRRQREKEEIQRRVLDAARELFASEGFEAVTMRKIAERVEYTPTALYFHFKDKDALFRRLCAEDFGALAARFQVLSRVPDAMERLRMLGRGYIAFALEHPHQYRLMFMTPGTPLGIADSERAAAGRELPDLAAYAFLRQTCSQAIAAGRLRPEFSDSGLVAQTLWAGLHGVAALAIARGDETWVDWRPIEERPGAMVDSLLRGLAREE